MKTNFKNEKELDKFILSLPEEDQIIICKITEEILNPYVASIKSLYPKIPKNILEWMTELRVDDQELIISHLLSL